ncbi:proteasome subunit beta type-6-like [Zingiber officinale]|uniref:proteasome subunit beta type-6-like n=1 Tax=Zingiber officinale TaxID=94328 RepID=UPI001C4AEC7E|nr:proteasome subunit beta type-6-like [Zingiber officinale]
MDLHLNAPYCMGTIVGVTYDDGVVLGADSRMTIGMLVANDSVSDKITQLTDKVYICRSGPAAVLEFVSDYVRNILDQQTIQFGQPATVKATANLVRLFSYKNTNAIQMGQMGMIVGGWDKYEGGQIFAVAQGGTILKLPYAIDGSGSSGIEGFLDRAWKEGMSKDKAEKLVVKAVSLAIASDAASGGAVRTVTINSDGVRKNCYPPDSLPLCDDKRRRTKTKKTTTTRTERRIDAPKP